MTTRVTVPVRFHRDPRTGRWSYLVQVGTMLGGDCATLEDAHDHAYAALLRALAEPDDDCPGEVAGGITLDVQRLGAREPARG